MVSDIVTFEQSPPKRPAEGDILNGAKTNDTPTVPPHMPSAEEYMQMARLLVAMGRMTPVLRVSIDYSSGTPYVHSVTSIRADITAGSLTVVEVTTGRVTISWPADTFPASTTRPKATRNAGASGGDIDAIYISNGVEVRTWNSSDAAAEVPFTVEVF